MAAALALFGIFSIFSILMGLSHNFVLYLAFMLCYGVPLTAFQTATTTFLQTMCHFACLWCRPRFRM